MMVPINNAHLFRLDLPFPSLALLVAAFHAQTTGHDAFTFEHIFDMYSRAARQSTNTNVSLDGVIVGLPRLPREVMVGVSLPKFGSMEPPDTNLIGVSVPH